MFESAIELLSSPLYLLSYLLIVAAGVLGVLNRRARDAAIAREEVAEAEAEEDPQWLQAQATVLEALGALGFEQDHEVADGSRLLMERADLTVSVSWDGRRRQVSARVAEPLQGSALIVRGPDATARQVLFTCRLPRKGKADRVIAQLAEQLQSRTGAPGA
ncbi:MAG: hypothetical protein ACYC3L_14365 [Gemmatimonadaceae bacterium]